jgi:mannose-1-phosphate guanylyltransferase
MTATSIDFGIIEKITDRIVVPMRGLGWDDVGSYESLYQVSPKDENENVNWGENILIESHGNLVRSTTKPIAMVRVDNMIILETEKAIMIIPREKAQDVKMVVDYLKER